MFTGWDGDTEEAKDGGNSFGSFSRLRKQPPSQVMLTSKDSTHEEILRVQKSCLLSAVISVIPDCTVNSQPKQAWLKVCSWDKSSIPGRSRRWAKRPKQMPVKRKLGLAFTHSHTALWLLKSTGVKFRFVFDYWSLGLPGFCSMAHQLSTFMPSTFELCFEPKCVTWTAFWLWSINVNPVSLLHNFMCSGIFRSYFFTSFLLSI